MSRIVVAGGLASRPGRGGHAWVFLDLVLGFQALGHEVIFVDRLDDRSARQDLIRVRRALEPWGVARDQVALASHGRSVGIDHDRLRRFALGAILFDVNGHLADDDLFGAFERRVLHDIDPGFLHLWQQLGWHQTTGRHDAYSTVGLAVGRPGSRTPALGVEWITTPPPIAMAPRRVWRDQPPGHEVGSVAAWRGPFDAIDLDGERLGLRAHSFRPLVDLPLRVRSAARFELALDITDADVEDRDALIAHGWRLRDPMRVCPTPSSFLRRQARSQLELMVAKELYVRLRTGWFSDRSAGYLAMGRPVVAQDTGWSQHLPAGEGLLDFTDASDAAEAIDAVLAEPERHAKAAAEMAEDLLAAPIVLERLLARAECG